MITLYYAGFAIALFAALHALTLSPADNHRHVYRAYLFLCIFIAVFLGATAEILGAYSLAEVATFSKWQTVGALGYLISFFWLMANYADIQFQRPVLATLIALTALCIGLAGYGITLPFGLFVENVELAGHTEILGSRLVLLDYDYRPMSVIYQALGFASIGWGAWTCSLLWHHQRRFSALLFGSYLLLLIPSYLIQLLYNFGHIQADLPGGFTFIWLFLIMALCFGHDTRTLISQLNAQSDRLRDEVERRRDAEQKARAQALTDELTGLPNQLDLRNRLRDQLLSGPAGLSLMLVRVNRLREIRQGLSETYCDDLLAEIAERLQADMPDSATVARFADDVFAVLGEDVASIELDRTHGSGHWLADCRLHQPYQAGYQSLDIGFCAGIIDLSDDDSAQTAIYKAEHALEEAGSLGKDAIVFYSEAIARQQAVEQRLETDLQKAAQNGELSVIYQPLVGRSGQSLGAEALLRWLHPDMGPVSPAVFIPLAERGGLASTLGNWVMEAVCAQMQQWRDEGAPDPGRISVNVSPWQLQVEDYADTVLASLSHYALQADWLTLEITETALVDNFDETRRQLEKLRSAGVQIALDDFGTGFSSLAYLSHLPLDALKIDKSFIDDVGTTRGRNVLLSRVNIGQALGLRVIVEGVETEEQHSILADMGCEIFQGYLFSHPLGGDEFIQWMASQRSAQVLP